jgi:DNA-directed RNA polymerase subunit RPC12/RpoP
MVIRPDKPIKCPHCRKDSGYTDKGLSMYLIPDEGLRCKECGEHFMKPNRPVLAGWST